MSSSLSILELIKIEELQEKDIFKIVISDKIVTSEKVSSCSQSFHPCYFNDIKDLCTDKAYERSCLIMHVYNDKQKNIVLRHFSIIQEFSQGLRDIIQTYIKIASNFNPDFYIRLFSNLISQMSVLLNSIIKVMRLLYSKQKVEKYRFTIYQPHYKK